MILPPTMVRTASVAGSASAGTSKMFCYASATHSASDCGHSSGAMLGGQMARLNRSAHTLTCVWPSLGALAGARFVDFVGAKIAGGRQLHHQSLLVAKWRETMSGRCN